VARKLIAATVLLFVVLLLASACSEGASTRAADETKSRCKQALQVNALRGDARPVSTGRATAVVLGDSYAQGIPGDTDPRSVTWPAPLGRRLGWTTYVNAMGATGFVNPGFCGGQQYATRVAAVLALHPAVVVVEGGLNDSRFASKVPAAADDLLRALAAVPTVYVLGPTAAPALDLASLQTVDAELASAARAAHRRYISAIKWKLPFISDGVHLTVAGQQQFAALIADVIG
jgi:lysophospholipase L1-like esterase